MVSTYSHQGDKMAAFTPVARATIPVPGAETPVTEGSIPTPEPETPQPPATVPTPDE